MSDVDIVLGAKDRASATIDRVAAKVGGSFGSAMKGIAPIAVGAGVALAGVTAAAKALSAGFDAVMDSAAALDELTKKARGLNETTENLRAFQFAMGEFSGVSPEKSAQGLQRLQRSVGEAIGGENQKAFERLQIDIDTISAAGPVEQFTMIQAALSKVENASERAALANDLLGRRAEELAPALLANAEAFSDSMRTASDLSADLSGGGAEGIEAMNDAVARVQTGMQGLVDQVAVALAPMIESVATQLAEWLPPIIDLAAALLPKVVDSLAMAVGYASDLGNLMLDLSRLDFSAAAESFNTLGDTGRELVASLDDARERARQAAIENANAVQQNIPAPQRDDSAQAELEERRAAARETTEQLERQLAVMRFGEEAIRRQEQLASATNSQERLRIANLQQQIAYQERQAELIEKQKAAVERQREEEAKATEERIGGLRQRASMIQKMFADMRSFDPGVQASEGRLTTRGASNSATDRIVTNTDRAAKLLDNILVAIQQQEENLDSLRVEVVG